MARKELGIYIHVPFCISKCKYCDFLSAPQTDEVIDAYFRSTESEIEKFSKQYKNEYVVRTVFFGGGTPSIVKSMYIEKVLDKLHEGFEFKPEVEITIEANPKTVDLVKLKVYKSCGVNRLSFGVQSSNDDELRRIGRVHTYNDFLQSYEAALKAGFTNINVDIMSALPAQTLKSYEKTLKDITRLRTNHVSAYSLILEPGTPLYKEHEVGVDLMLPGEEEEREMYYITEDYLSKSGLKRYEISNYAKPGFECKHNISYWTGIDYAGFGIGASSFINGRRYTNNRDILKYNANPEVEKSEDILLDENDKMSEFMFLGLRMMEGISMDEFRIRFSRHIDSVFGDVIDKYIKMSMMEKDDKRIWLTRKGIDVSNTIFTDFLI